MSSRLSWTLLVWARTRPLLMFLSLSRTNAEPLPGLTYSRSTQTWGWLLIRMNVPLEISLARIIVFLSRSISRSLASAHHGGNREIDHSLERSTIKENHLE